jgi:hypothetical protein
VDDDLTEEQLKRVMTLSQAAKLMRGRDGKHPHITNVRRWANPRRGWRAPDGTVHVLRCAKVSAQLVTLPEWVRAFELVRMGESDKARRAAGPMPRTPTQRAAAARRANARLDKRGVGGKPQAKGA